ncbi:MAG: S-methyl-5-thioribose-1-phosphate isomerase [Syntrophales bacterium]|nr:S-methyl-5-thioribose-1-phosphate isomerase [Syntrophales bacterium]HPB70219.1 S-methyl-5-thioribose-1-phosphate isomerase [Syntrophales bacterium]HQN25730.1 S-methyl-5-thioribose-1-phosphate isomerase [Syntrophales bacterium]HQP28361.1 S-methyl-5-thioribose-1-phosphate isomerase [Syntrophales bacterium]
MTPFIPASPAPSRWTDMEDAIHTLFWRDDTVVLLDQKALPREERYVTCTDYREVVAAIRDLTVRGAPAIGVAAALGIALGVRHLDAASIDAFREAFWNICGDFAAARPTARNLFWAIERMQRRFDAALVDAAGSAVPPGSGSLPRGRGERDRLRAVSDALIAEAIRIGEEDLAINRRLGRHGSVLIKDGARILTHCNAGALATAGYGTALGVIRAAREAGKALHVYVDETRPVLQGARLTAWELTKEGVPCTLITDNMAGFLMQRGKIDLVIVGADRIAANGDTANKIGTYALAVLAHAHGLPFYVAAPWSTVDFSLADGTGIPIEERDPGEVVRFAGVATAPEGIAVYNPAFDVTPHRYITAIITEDGVLTPPLRRPHTRDGR